MTPMPTFDPGFTTPAMTAVFSETARVRHMLAVECALARVLAHLGIAPAEAAAAIESACHELDLDGEALLAEGWEVGTPVIPLVRAISERLDPDAAEWLHHGATTQDIVDTALMIQMKEGLEVIAGGLRRTNAHLAHLVRTHRRTPMTGRTFLQPATGTTFGVVAAGWLAALGHHLDAARRQTDVLPIQLGGPVGDGGRYGARIGDVMRSLASALGLAEPVAAWHSDRTVVAETVAVLQSLCRSVAKIASDIAHLTEHGEVSVRSGGSSSMAHKANPIDAIRALAAADACHGAASVVTGGRPHELQRGVGGWHAEWWAVPMSFHTAAAAVASIERCVGSIEVDAEQMAANLTGADIEPPHLDSADAVIDRILRSSSRQDPP